MAEQNDSRQALGIEETLKKYIEREMVGTYTISTVIVKEVDTQQRRCEVAMKYEKNVILDDVPIASPYVGDEFGTVFPVAKDDEGFVMHNRQPIKNALNTRGHIKQQVERRFTVEDAILFPLMWNGDLTIPDHEEGELVIAHKSGTTIRIKPDGTTTVLTGVGEQGLTLDTQTGGVKLLDEGGYGLVSDGSGNYTFHREDIDYNDSTASH